MNAWTFMVGSSVNYNEDELGFGKYIRIMGNKAASCYKVAIVMGNFKKIN